MNFLRLLFDEVNEKIVLIDRNRKNFNCKRLFKLIAEHKSIEKKVQLYYSTLTRCTAYCLVGLIVGFIANLYVVIFSNNHIHKIFSFLTGFTCLMFEVMLMFEMVALT